MSAFEAAEHPREVLRRVVTVLHQRGQITARALPGAVPQPRTCWQPHHLRIFQVYHSDRQVRGGKSELAKQLGLSPFELARRFRVAQGLLLEVYFVAGLVAPQGTLSRLDAVHAYLNVYDGISHPKRLRGNPDQVYWNELPTDSRLSLAQRSLLRAAATTLTADDLAYINVATAHSWPCPVSINLTAAADAYRKLTSSGRSAASHSDPPKDHVEEFARALHEAEERYRELISQWAPSPPTRVGRSLTQVTGGRT